MILPMPGASIPQMVALADRLAREAAEITARYPSDRVAEHKPGNTLVTEVDRRIEEHIGRAIRAAFPGHAVLGEESWESAAPNAARRGSGYCWVVDPLDGTRNFIAGIPVFATSIAVLDAGQPVVGVIFEHNSKQAFTATAGGGAMLNGAPIHATEPPEGFDWLLGIASSKDELSIRVIHRWAPQKGLILRNFGSTAWQLGLVASGGLHGSFCKQCKIWDIAAGVLIVHEAGGVVTTATGQPVVPFDLSRDPGEDLPILAGPPKAHARLRESLTTG